MNKDDPFSEEKYVMKVSGFFLFVGLALLIFDMITDRLPAVGLGLVALVIIVSGYFLIKARDATDPNGKCAMIKGGFIVKFTKRQFLPEDLYEQKYGKPKPK